MRLSQSEVTVLLNTIKQVDVRAEVRLFGSRANDLSFGGDIDILILSQEPSLFNRSVLRNIRQVFFNHFGEQKIDLVIDSPEPTHPFVQTIMPHSILLHLNLSRPL